MAFQNNRVYDPLTFDKKVRNMDFRWTHSKNTYPTKPEGDIIEEASRIWKEYEEGSVPFDYSVNTLFNILMTL